MKITNSADKLINGTKSASPNESVGSAAIASVGKTDRDSMKLEASTKVSLSPLANQMAHGPDESFDAAKVESIRNAIADGSYKINPEAIADKLISNALELLSPRQT